MKVTRSLRVERTVTLLPNSLLRDQAISLAARGLMAYILSHPDGREPSKGDLYAGAGDAADTIAEALAELERAGLIKSDAPVPDVAAGDNPYGVAPQTWIDFKALRLRKKAPITETAMARIQAEAKDAGWTMQEALTECCARGWQGFRADWVARKTTSLERAQHGFSVLAPVAASRELREVLDVS